MMRAVATGKDDRTMSIHACRPTSPTLSQESVQWCLTHLMERSLVPELLKEDLIALWLLPSALLGSLHVLPHALLLRHRTTALDLVALLLSRRRGGLVSGETL